MEARFGGFEDCPGGDSDMARLGAADTGPAVVETCSVSVAGAAAAAGDALACSGGGAEAAEPPTVTACLVVGGAEASLFGILLRPEGGLS